MKAETKYNIGDRVWTIDGGINVSMGVRSVHLLQLALRLCEIEKQITL